jgi:hypothetical protein
MRAHWAKAQAAVASRWLPDGRSVPARNGRARAPAFVPRAPSAAGPRSAEATTLPVQSKHPEGDSDARYPESKLQATGAGLVLSIPGGYVDQSGDQLRYLPGLLVPGSANVVDRSLPRRYAEQLLAQIERMTFERVGFHQQEGDVYVYARKSAG